MVKIHPTAIVESGASLGDHVEIGPYCLVGPQVTLGNHCVLRSHVTLEGKTTIGEGNVFFQFSVVGAVPQDLKYRQENSQLIIGHHNTFRESSSVHIGTDAGGGLTQIGDRNLLMGYVHIAHDCRVGSDNIFANYTGLSGHVVIDDFVRLGGHNGITQFVRIGSHSYFGAGSVIDQNIVPYARGQGNRVQIRGINYVGLQRQGYSDTEIKMVAQLHRIFFRQGLSLEEAVAEIHQRYGDHPAAQYFIKFVKDTGQNFKKWRE